MTSVTESNKRTIGITLDKLQLIKNIYEGVKGEIINFCNNIKELSQSITQEGKPSDITRNLYTKYLHAMLRSVYMTISMTYSTSTGIGIKLINEVTDKQTTKTIFMTYSLQDNGRVEDAPICHIDNISVIADKNTICLGSNQFVFTTLDEMYLAFKQQSVEDMKTKYENYKEQLAQELDKINQLSGFISKNIEIVTNSISFIKKLIEKYKLL